MAYMKKVVDNKKGSGVVNLATGAKVITLFSGIPIRVPLSPVVFSTPLLQVIGVIAPVVSLLQQVCLKP